MKRQTKLDSTEQQQSRQVGTEQQTQQPSALEFATPEELLRYDAAHTSVPPGIAQRLQKSVAQSDAPRPRWWRRFFGASNP